MFPIISVIVPMYNIAERIVPMARSLCSQDFRGFEVIFVNDASTDETELRLKEFLTASGTAVPFAYSFAEHETNRGSSASRNDGLKAAKGDYVIFIDGDDMLEPAFLSSLYKAVSENGADYAACGYKTLEISNGRVKEHPFELPKDLSKEGILIATIINKIEISHWTTLYRHDFLVSNGLHYEVGYSKGEDTEFVIKMLCCAKKGSFCRDCLYVYVQHDNMGSRTCEKNKEDRIKRYAHNTDMHLREAEYIQAHTSDKRLLSIARHMLLPLYHQRMLALCAMNGDRKAFDRMRSEKAFRKILRGSYQSFFYKPEVFLKSLLALRFPNVFYKRYSNY